MKTGVLRNEDQKSAMRSLREYLDTIKQNKQRTDSTSEGAAAKERDPTRTSMSISASQTPGLGTIAESAATISEDEVLGPPPRMQRMASEDAPSPASVVVAVEGGDMGVVEDVVGGTLNTTAKAQDVVGGVWPNGTAEKGVATNPVASQHDPTSVQVVKRAETGPVANPAHSVARAPPDSAPQQQLSAVSQSNIAASEHPPISLPEEERKHIRTNSTESTSDKRQVAPPPQDEKQVGVSEATAHSHKFIVETVPAIAIATETGANRFDEVATATPTHIPTTTPLQVQELGIVQSEHSAESTPTHFSQGGLESTSATAIPSQEQLLTQESKDKSTIDKLATEKGANGTLKKKGARGKSKQIKLNFVEMTDEKVVKCALVTVTGQMVNFQFSMKYDKPVVMFQKLVCYCYWFIVEGKVVVGGGGGGGAG